MVVKLRKNVAKKNLSHSLISLVSCAGELKLHTVAGFDPLFQHLSSLPFVQSFPRKRYAIFDTFCEPVYVIPKSSIQTD